jgi:hypothetical protein
LISIIIVVVIITAVVFILRLTIITTTITGVLGLTLGSLGWQGRQTPVDRVKPAVGVRWGFKAPVSMLLVPFFVKVSELVNDLLMMIIIVIIINIIITFIVTYHHHQHNHRFYMSQSNTRPGSTECEARCSWCR